MRQRMRENVNISVPRPVQGRFLVGISGMQVLRQIDSEQYPEKSTSVDSEEEETRKAETRRSTGVRNEMIHRITGINFWSLHSNNKFTLNFSEKRFADMPDHCLFLSARLWLVRNHCALSMWSTREKQSEIVLGKGSRTLDKSLDCVSYQIHLDHKQIQLKPLKPSGHSLFIKNWING